MKKYHTVALAIILGFAIIGAGGWYFSDQKSAQAVLLSDAIAVPMPGKEDAVQVSLKFSNTGEPQHLLAVGSKEANGARFVNGDPGASLVVPGGSTAVLASDGAFVVLEGIDGDLNDGRLLPLTFTLKPAGQITTKVRFSAKPKMMMHSMAMGHKLSKDHPSPKVEMTVTKSAAADGWMVSLDVVHFRFAEDLVDGDHVPGTGHGHLYLNGLKLGRLYSPSAEIGRLPAGDHTVRVTLNTNNHMPYMTEEGPVTTSTTISVPGSN